MKKTPRLWWFKLLLVKKTHRTWYLSYSTAWHNDARRWCCGRSTREFCSKNRKMLCDVEGACNAHLDQGCLMMSSPVSHWRQVHCTAEDTLKIKKNARITILVYIQGGYSYSKHRGVDNSKRCVLSGLQCA